MFIYNTLMIINTMMGAYIKMRQKPTSSLKCMQKKQNKIVNKKYVKIIQTNRTISVWWIKQILERQEMASMECQLSEALVPIKDVVIGTEESYIRYSNWLQVYYLFVLFKVVFGVVAVGIVVGFGLRVEEFCYGELLWLIVGYAIKGTNTPYASVMLRRVLIAYFITLSGFIGLSYLFFVYSLPAPLDHSATIIWVVHFILNIIALYLLIILLHRSIKVIKNSKQIQNQDRYKLKPIKVGRMSMHLRKSSTKKQLKSATSTPITPRGHSRGYQKDYQVKKANSSV